MEELVTTLTQRGQTSIPAKVRRDMHLKPGMRLQWEEISENECRLVIKHKPINRRGARAMRGYAKTFRDTRRTHDWMRELREGEE